MLAARHLTKTYGALTAIRDVSLEVRRGEIVGLLGPNGCGKSTTVKILCGLMHATSGHVVFDDVDIQERVCAYKAIVGYVPEEAHVYPYLTAAEFLMMVGRLRGIDERRLSRKIDCFMQVLDLLDAKYESLSAYSKGMKQKVLIAAAVLHDPEILVLDEPFSGLDVGAGRLLKSFVQRLASQGKVVVFSSHILEIVQGVCSRVVVLNNGGVAGEVSTDGLRQPSGGQIRSLEAAFGELVAGADLDGRLQALLSAVTA